MKELKSVVFDQLHFEAFIKLALDEKLLIVDDMKTDGVFRRFKSMKVKPAIKKRVLEQITYSSQVITSNVFFDKTQGLSGKLVEEEYIVFDQKPEKEADEDSVLIIENIPTDRMIELYQKAFPMPIILSIINSSRKEKFSKKQVSNILRDGLNAVKEQLNFERTSGKSAPDIGGVQQLMTEVFNKAGLVIPDQLDNYTKYELEAQKKRNRIYRKASPILNGLTEFIDVTESAKRNKAFAKFATPGRIYKTKSAIKFDNRAMAIFKIIADGLGKMTHRNTLTESIELSTNEATAALRIYINELVQNIENLNEREIQKIRKEVSKALTVLAKNKDFNKDARFFTYVGLPVSVLGSLGFVSPVIGSAVTIGGIAISLLGVINTKVNQDVEDSHRWATFQNS